MTVLVAMPYWNAAPYVERAVASVLGQSERDLVCLVVGDGEKPPLRVRDDRLVVHSFATNRGAPFTQQAMLLGSPFESYAPFGSDDWADPDHLALLRSLGPNVAAGAVWWHDGEAEPYPVAKAFEVGCFSTNDLRSIGGYGAHERMGQDSLLLHILARTVGYAATDRPTYHRVVRPGALGTMPETRKGSEAREQMRRRNWRVADRCSAMGWQPERIRAYRERFVPASLQAQLLDDAGEIGRLLGERMEVAA